MCDLRALLSPLISPVADKPLRLLLQALRDKAGKINASDPIWPGL